MPGDADAIVVGSGPNGLAAAVTLAAAGLRVQVIEGAAAPGGGCRTEELTLPGFRHDVCSAAHPLALASPFFRRFGPAARGVAFAHPEVVYAHPLDGGRAAIATRSVAETAARLGGDAGAYRRLMQPLAGGGNAVADAVLSSMRRPPRYSGALAAYARLGLRSAAAVARRFHTDEARGLFAGVAAHAMLPLTEPPTAGVALLLGSLAHTAGWPVVAGGSARLADAMIDAIVAGGGQVETGQWVRSLAGLPPAPATLLDVAPRAFLAMAGERLPARYRDALARFRYGPGICKVDFALSGPVPWRNEAARQAGTLHLGGGFEEIAAAEAAVARGEHPDSPYVLVVQAGVADPSRAPRGRDALWAYCHVPSGSTLDMTAQIEAQIERFAPGFTDLVLARHTRTAAQEEEMNPNYVGGDIACGMQTVRQVLARPAVRWNPYRTPLRGVYLCSSATPPGPGVHGRCGELAALTALRDVFGVRKPPDLAIPRGLPRGGLAGPVGGDVHARDPLRGRYRVRAGNLDRLCGVPAHPAPDLVRHAARGRAGRRRDAELYGRRGDAGPDVRRLAARHQLAVVRLAAAARHDQPDRRVAADHLVAAATARRAVIAALAAPAGRLDPAGRRGAERAPHRAPAGRRGACLHRGPRRVSCRDAAQAKGRSSR